MPTTLGSSAGAANSALRGRRWGMVGGAAAAVIAGALAIVAFPGGRVATPHAGSPAPEAAAPGADPAPSMPAEPEAPPSPAVAPPPAAVPTRAMAKLAVAPVDAGTVDAADAAPAVARPESPPVDPDAPARTKPHKPRTAIPAQPEDVGASRF
jgi:hypothetical protein